MTFFLKTNVAIEYFLIFYIRVTILFYAIFTNFGRNKFAFFLKTNVAINVCKNLEPFEQKKKTFFGENVLKPITSVPTRIVV
jgi:hypothetical protein